MKIDQAVMDAHAQFGGDLETMQKSYEWPALQDEIARLRQALSEAEKRADDARRQSLEDAAKVADDIGTWRHKFVSAASAIRAMKSEERG